MRDLVHHKRSLSPMSYALTGIASSNDFGWACMDPSGNTTTKNICQAFPSGELWGISSQVFVQTQVRHFVRSDEAATALGVIAVEKLCTRTLKNFVKVASTVMQLRQPFVVRAGSGLKGVYMGAPHPNPEIELFGPMHDDSLFDVTTWRRRIARGSTKSCATFSMSSDLAEVSRSEILTDEHVHANDIPRRTSLGSPRDLF